MEGAWDVPRELSLPGLAERLGVVRSALNPPIALLEKDGFVHTRKAHVIGGGHRKRTVIHITEKGRKVAAEFEPEEKIERIGEFQGKMPALTDIHGRKDLLLDVMNGLENGATLQVVGLPGIGKTSLLRVLAENALSEGWNVNWVTMQSFHDVGKLSSELLSLGDGPKDIEAAFSEVLDIAKNTLFVVDELQAVHERHKAEVMMLMCLLAESDDVTIAIGCRAPTPIETGTVFKIDEISEDEARKLLPEDLEDSVAQQVISGLGGHPLALKLWQPGHSLPEADDRIQEFIRTDVVEKLPNEEITTLDELAASPLPILADQMSNDEGVEPLDEAALLRWNGEALELQHLVRNVRRTMWNEDEARKIHSSAAKYWAQRIEPEARVHEAHHRVQAANSESEDEVSNSLEDGIQDMLTIDSAAAAAIISDAIRILPNAHRLRLLSAKVAIERGEGELAEKELSQCDKDLQKEAQWRLLSARIKRLGGKFDEANKQEQLVLEEADPTLASKIRLNRLILGLEDRLPGTSEEKTRDAVEEGISEVDLSALTANNRKAALVTIAAIRHSLALETGDPEVAAKIRTDLATTASPHDPVIEEMSARAALVFGGDSTRVRSLISRTSNPLRRCALGLLLVNHAHQQNDSDIAEILATVEHPADMGTTTARRLSAQHWYWRGLVDSGQRVKCWQEALHRFGMAECANAYIQLQHKLHDAVRLI
ncbi:MAG: AAA family ATPase [Candidatus Poseidoniales archaeon]|nr:AAA family ATPase [Candidatus Poseidoniales archaeon]